MEYLTQNIVNVTRGIVVHGTNTRGVMGSGVALAIRKKWPIVFDEYYEHCVRYRQQQDDLSGLLGTVQMVQVLDDSSLYVANLFSQDLYGRDNKPYAKVDAIRSGLEEVLIFADKIELPVYSVKIGSGLGGLNWDNDVEPIYVELATQYNDVAIYICDI
jgi:O-acetyl-ADP-ribose deacetylase (regulator of RNase III)